MVPPRQRFTFCLMCRYERPAEGTLDRVVFRGEHRSTQLRGCFVGRRALESLTEVPEYPTALCDRSSEEGIDWMLEAEVTSGWIAGWAHPARKAVGCSGNMLSERLKSVKLLWQKRMADCCSVGIAWLAVKLLV